MEWVAHHYSEQVKLRPSRDRSDPCLIPDRGPLLHVLPSLSHTFRSISLYNKV